MIKDLVSIVVRTKNESFWISKCLHAISLQDYKNYEVIVVDNNSRDNTVEIIKKNFPKTKIISYKSKIFLPGKALNLGISKAKGKYIAMLSGHCIPKNNKWLKNFVKNIKQKKIAGCYGKQEPLDMSNPNDVRDLYYLFGRDKKIQTKEPFFHNANSIIKKSLWNKYKFDENTNHIEDRIWAQEMLNLKYKIIYEPEACVYHFHGVSHSQNISRVSKISKIITKSSITKKPIICAITVIKKPILKKDNNYLIQGAIDDLLKIKKIQKIFIVTDDLKIQKKIKNRKIIYIKRPHNLSEDILGADQILKDAFVKINKKYKPTHLLSFEEIYVFRPKNFFKKLIESYDDNYDCLVPISCFSKDHNIWKKNGLEMDVVYKTSLPSSINKHLIYREIKGLGCIIKSLNIEANGRESSNTKFFEVPNKFAFNYDTSLINLVKRFQ